MRSSLARQHLPMAAAIRLHRSDWPKAALIRAVLIVFVGLALHEQPVQGADLTTSCGGDFAAVAETAEAVVCRSQAEADSAMLAERLSRRWAAQARCDGAIEGLQSSISEVGSGIWLVVVRYACAR